jgi:hypothetical protein
MTLNSADKNESKFKQAALDAIRKSDIFRELLDHFKSKLPSLDGVATRLENQKRFNAERAKLVATVLEKSLHYAGLLDGSNNILPIRDTPGANGDQPDRQERCGPWSDRREAPAKHARRGNPGRGWAQGHHPVPAAPLRRGGQEGRRRAGRDRRVVAVPRHLGGGRSRAFLGSSFRVLVAYRVRSPAPELRFA